jgi:hypothetical protein
LKINSYHEFRDDFGWPNFIIILAIAALEWCEKFLRQSPSQSVRVMILFFFKVGTMVFSYRMISTERDIFLRLCVC